jgi:hypothetical protein
VLVRALLAPSDMKTCARTRRPSPIRVAVLAAAVATRAWAGESASVRAADAGLPPDFCPMLRTLVAAAPNGFASLRGAPEAGSDNVREGTTRLPGASRCSVFCGTPAAYVCTLYAGDVEEKADATYDRVVSGLGDCLAGGWKTTERVDGVHARTTTAAGGAGPSVRVVSRDASADAYLVELWVDAGRR